MRMLRNNFKRLGKCHPWCGNFELEVGRAAEQREWRREADDELSDDQS